jgi:hypothetical protein
MADLLEIDTHLPPNDAGLACAVEQLVNYIDNVNCVGDRRNEIPSLCDLQQQFPWQLGADTWKI